MRFSSATIATLVCALTAALPACGNGTNSATHPDGWSRKAVASAQGASLLVGGFSADQRNLYRLGLQHIHDTHQPLGNFTVRQIVQQERGREQQRQALIARARAAEQARAAAQAASKTASGTAAAYQEFDTEDAAQANCPRDEVVWLNTNSGIYHEKGMRWYGNTEYGAYVCRNAADAAGDRITENGQ
jgi:hypothetical protein